MDPERQRILDALRTAHGLGHTAEATRLAQMVREFDARAQQPAAATPPPHTPGASAPPPVATGPMRQIMRDVRNFGETAQIGAEALGRGALGAVGAPADILTAGAQGLTNITAMGANALGANVEPFDLGQSPIGAEALTDAAGRSARAAGIDVIGLDGLSDPERTLSRGLEFAAGGGLGGAAVARRAAAQPLKTGSRLVDPYRGPSPGRVIAGDTAAGAGAGSVYGATENVFGEDLEDLPPAVALPASALLQAIGGVAGSTTLSVAGALRRGATRTARESLSGTVPTDVLAPPDGTATPVRVRDRDQAAAFLQERAVDVPRALEGLDAAEAAAGPGPKVPGLLATDDEGLIALDKALRIGDAPRFAANDREIGSAVSSRVREPRPEGADPRLFGGAIREVQAADAAAAAEAVEHAELLSSINAGDRRSLGDRLRRSPDASTIGEASAALDHVLVDEALPPRRTEKNRLFSAALADGTPRIKTPAAQESAAGVLRDLRRRLVLPDGETRGIARALAGRRLASEIDGDDDADFNAALAEAFGVNFEPTAESAVPGRALPDIDADIRALREAEQKARAAGEFGRADRLREMRKGLQADVESAAQSGAPGTEALAEAQAYFRDEFAPFFRDGPAAGQFFRDLSRDPSRSATPPTATAAKFLKVGGGSAESAQDLAKIIEIAPNPDAGLAAARDYIIHDAITKGVVGADGVVNETALARFISQREDMLGAFPTIREELDTTLHRAQFHAGLETELAAELKAQVAKADLDAKFFSRAHLAGAIDGDPSKAVQSIFNAPDPAQAMRDINATIARSGGGDSARESLKAAVTDYSVRKFSASTEAAARGGDVPTTLGGLRRFLDDNREALAEIYDPEDMAALEQSMARLKILSRRGVQATTGSPTAENLSGAAQAWGAASPIVELALKATFGILKGGGINRTANVAARQLLSEPAAARDLLARAALDPAVARHLLNTPISERQTETWNKRLFLLLGIARGADDGADE